MTRDSDGEHSARTRGVGRGGEGRESGTDDKEQSNGATAAMRQKGNRYGDPFGSAPPESAFIPQINSVSSFLLKIEFRDSPENPAVAQFFISLSERR